MEKKTFTALYIAISSLANIVLSVALVLVLVLLAGLLLTALHVQSATVATLVLLACFVLGIVLGFIIFTRVSNFIIKKYGLEKKLSPRWSRRAGTAPYNYSYSELSEAENSEKTPPRKTNMPPSLTLSEQEIEEAEKWGDDL